LSINLKKLGATARRRLAITGKLEFKAGHDSHSSLSLITSSTDHIIAYSNTNEIQPTDVFHELCRAKMNELGYTTIENASLNAMRECCRDDPKYIRDANSAVAIVSEVYTNYLLFSYFEEESRKIREHMIQKFTSITALNSLHLQMGFWGIAGVCYYKLASELANVPFPESQIHKAIQHCSTDVSSAYYTINDILPSLPQLKGIHSRISDTDSIEIVGVIVRLFSSKTGF
jgi:hypothetical protein